MENWNNSLISEIRKVSFYRKLIFFTYLINLFMVIYSGHQCFNCRTRSTAVLRAATPPRPRRRTVVMKGVYVTLQMVTLTVQPAAWEWAWGQTETVHGITHPSLFTRRREKIETINYPPLRTNIPVTNSFTFF